MYDDVYYDQYSGKIINVTAPSEDAPQDEEVDEADKYLAQFEEK
jgi:hypothetical protein